jgi:hypothetical protein
MSTSEVAPTPKFLEAADALIESLERLHHDAESLEIAMLRLRNMILTQRQWSQRATRREPSAAGSSAKPVQGSLLERLLQAEERCQALLLNARSSSGQGEV